MYETDLDSPLGSPLQSHEPSAPGAAGPIDVATVSRGNRLRDPRAFSCIWQPRLLTPRLPWKRYAHLQRVLIEPSPLADKLTFDALTPPLAGASGHPAPKTSAPQSAVLGRRAKIRASP
jgi:hypothetical protein